MASFESMTLSCNSVQEDGQECDEDHDMEDGSLSFDRHHPHMQSLSRLSVCTSSLYTNEDGDDDVGDDCDGMRMFLSKLSLESFDADEELSDFDEEKSGPKHTLDGLISISSSDSDKDPGCYSLPATPPRRRNRGGLVSKVIGEVKEYASENEAQKGVIRQKGRKNLRKRRVIKERLMGRDDQYKKKEEEIRNFGYCNSFSGESEGGGLMVITRPKGGERSLCMDLEEVKACRDLGFELEHERMLEMPGWVSLSGSGLDTSSGGNSPIANWRISSPGDDPKDVKARLKVWAQAVALASSNCRV